MELVQDLILTASFALILSFLVAKLLAVAVNGRESEVDFVKAGTSGEGAFMEEVRFEERLKVEEAFQAQRRVKFDGEVKSVDQFEVKPVDRDAEVEEPPQHRQEGSELKEEVLDGSVAVAVPEKSSDGEEKVSVEKEVDFDGQRGNEEKVSVEKEVDFDSQFQDVTAESATNDVVASQTEESRVVDCSGDKGGAHEASEVKLDNYSDDDWEGIEKSEVDDEFTAAVKSDGR